jgi:predicted SnoaL-like aldol condensation-catalyzing enzyme
MMGLCVFRCHEAIIIRSGSIRLSSDPESVVLDLIELLAGQRKVEEAAMKYIAEDYVQHNPNSTDGRDAWIATVRQILAQWPPEAEFNVKRVIASGDLVVTHSHSKRTKDDRGSAVVDIYRVVDGRVVEHWDVIQPVPEQAMNSNTMF